MIFNSEAYNGSVSPAFCSPNESGNGDTWATWLSFSMSNIGRSNPFKSSDTKFRVTNSKGEFDFKAYNDTFYENQFITKDMLHPVKPITSTLKWLGRAGNLISVFQIGKYIRQACNAEDPYDEY